MSNLAQRSGNDSWSRTAEPEDSWDRPVRMLYLVTIEVRDTHGTRFFFVLARNYHNAEAIQGAFDGMGNIDVSFVPDVLRYIATYG